MSKKRKGLSVDDKRKVILGIYHDKKEPLNLKEIETMGSRLGVVQQTIKEVNQSLVDDFLVITDKIGAANFYWSFPSKSYQDQITLKENTERGIAAVKNSIDNLNSQHEEARKLRKGNNRGERLKMLDSLRSREKDLEALLEEHKYNDPAQVKKVIEAAKVCQDGANRWTDGIWSIKSFLTRKKGMSGKDVGHCFLIELILSQVDKMLKIDSSFDYV